MSLLQDLERLEEQMEICVRQNRFDTFNQLASDRQYLLKRAQHAPEKEAVMALAKKQTARWVELLDGRVGQMRIQRMQSKPLVGYGSSKHAGRFVNRSL